MIYGYKRKVNLNFEDAIVNVKGELKKEGFGVLTEIDVKKTLKEKLNVDYDDYVILGACNPDFALKALNVEKEIGLLLPCNVIVYVNEGDVFVSAINPIEAMSIIDNEGLKEIAIEVKEKLERVVDNVVGDLEKHWENVFTTKNFNEVSWFQENPNTSIDLILSVNANKSIEIIDVGGGDSNLVDKLIDMDYENVSVLDISLSALKKSQQRLGEKEEMVKWINSDVKKFEIENRFDIWHDRALFHFLTSDKDVREYVEQVKKFLKSSGYLIIGVFSFEGPEKCCGLDVRQYSKESMRKIFDEGFEFIKSFEEEHSTPFKTTQSFIWNVFKKI